MSPHRPVRILLVIGGLALLLNPVWLVPHEGQTQYTYERSEILVENGTFAYDGKAILGFAEVNSLNPVGCQSNDDEQPRACAFDSSLVDSGPVTVPNDYRGEIQPEFVRLGDAYYRRVHITNESSEDRVVRHDVERVTPQTVLSDSALNISDPSRFADLGLEPRIAATGETVTSFESLDEEDLGRIYRLNRSYYTVVGTDEKVIDHGLGLLQYELPRYLLMGVGLVLLVGVLFLSVGNQDR